MAEELKQAARQALMECPFCGSEPHDAHHIEYGRWAVTCRCGAKGASANTGPNATDAAKIKAYSDARTAWNTRALTQRPAAQTEREAFESRVTLNSIIKQYRIKAEDAHWLRASLPAPQQATPEPDDAQIRAIGEGLRSAHDHIEMHKLERSHCKDAERIREGLAAFSAYKKRGDFAATPEPLTWAPLKRSADGRAALLKFFMFQLKRHDFLDYITNTLAADFACVLGGYLQAMNTAATPEPVGEPWGWAVNSTLFRGEFAEADAKAEAKRCGGTTRAVALYDRPAPGVPEGFALVPMTEDQVWHNDSIMSANAIGGLKMDAVMRIVRGVEAHHSERLAAAQAKGGE